MEKLTQLIQTLWSENKLSKEAYADLLNFTNENQALQLQQTGVSGSFYCFERHIETGDCKKQCKDCERHENN